jgi:hypothetical protein
MRECQNETRACALADRTCRSQDTEAAGHHLHLPELMEPVNLVQLQFVRSGTLPLLFLRVCSMVAGPELMKLLQTKVAVLREASA